MAWPSPFMCALELVVVVSAIIHHHAIAREDGFSNPSNAYRPKFRYWCVLPGILHSFHDTITNTYHPFPLRLPDASVSSDIVAKDISSMAAIGAGGLQFLPFYLYGLIYTQIGMSSAVSDSIAPPTDWSIYGFGDEAFNVLFKTVLQAVKDEGDGFVIDFALGPNQGAGVPSAPGSDGLAVHLVSFSSLANVIGAKHVTLPCEVSVRIVSELTRLPIGTRKCDRDGRAVILRTCPIAILAWYYPVWPHVPKRTRAVWYCQAHHYICYESR